MTEHIRIATEIGADNLAKLIATFRDQLGLQLPNPAGISSSLERLLTKRETEFLIAYTNNESSSYDKAYG